MADDKFRQRVSRSPESLRFEEMIRGAALPGLLPKLEDINVNDLTDLSGWIAVVHPSAISRALTFTHAGAALSLMQGGPLVGLDYLDLVDPTYKGEAFDSAFLMLTRPSGLWQITPVRYSDGENDHIEYTGFPAYDDKNHCGVIVFMVKNYRSAPASIAVVGHAINWEWLDLRMSLVD